MIECTGMSDAALAHELKQTVHQSGRIITVVAAGAAGALPALGLVLERGSTTVARLLETSALRGRVRAGDVIVKLIGPHGDELECARANDDGALARALAEGAAEAGRRAFVVPRARVELLRDLDPARRARALSGLAADDPDLLQQARDVGEAAGRLGWACLATLTVIVQSTGSLAAPVVAAVVGAAGLVASPYARAHAHARGAAPPLTRARDADNLAVLLLCALCVGFAMAARLSRRPSEHALALAPYLAMAAGTAAHYAHADDVCAARA